MAEIGVNQIEASFKDGCLSLRLATLMKQRAATSPGPIYDMPQTLGKQVESTTKTAPLIGFTKGGMTKVGRPIENVSAKEVPGPGKYELDCITYGRQVNSQMKTACMPSFGLSNRPPLIPNGCSPGPYTAFFVTRPDERGPSPSIIGPTWRYKKSSELNNPGPGSYDLPPASGKQILSTKPSLPLCSFGGGNVNRGLAKAKAGSEPGPGQYNPVVKSGNIRAITFGSGPQRPPAGGSKYDIKPAPNKYLLPSAMGAQPSSKANSSPAYSFGAR